MGLLASLSGVHLSNHAVVVAGEVLSHLLVDGVEVLAVTAPWSIELDEDIPAFGQDNVVEVARVELLSGRRRRWLDGALFAALLGDQLGDALQITARVELFRFGRSSGGTT